MSNAIPMSAVLPPGMTREQVLALAKALTGNTTGGIKISAKGAVSVYGLGRFPVTLYASQWESLFAKVEEIRAFINANKAQLATKGQA